MALKALMLRKRIDDKRKELAKLTESNDFQQREADLTVSISEAETEEEKRAVEEAIDAFETEKAQVEEAVTVLTEEIRGLESELEAEEAKQEVAPVVEPEPVARKDEHTMSIRTNFYGLDVQQRDAMFAREDVKGWISEVRSHISEKRALTNVGLTIPEVFLGLLKQNIENYSKLYKHVNVKPVSGNARVAVMGTIPEAIWTDCCANLNELDLTFNDAEADCFKCGGYYAICNAALEDSDVDLAAEILTALGQAIGLALDKAILFGRNGAGAMKMPQGIVSRLVQESQPDSYPTTARAWVDLHTSNVKTISADYTGANLFKQIIINAGAAKGKYSRGIKTWVMNETTHTKLIAEALSINAAGAIATGVGSTMPIIGGDIEVLDFIPDNVIIGGYFDLYMLAERAGAKFATSEHVRFLADQTVMKGTARYDGLPVIAEGFVAIGIGGTTPSASMTFAADEANGVSMIALNTATASVAVAGTVKLYAITSPGTGTVTWTSGTAAKATVASDGTVTGVAAGSSVITATCNGLTATCTVTVTSA